MNVRGAIAVVVLATLAACGSAPNEEPEAPMTVTTRELIVLAAPRSEDAYYAPRAEAIFDFHVDYARAIQTNDDVLVLADAGNYARYVEALGKAAVTIAPQDDIWMRDFGLSNTAAPARLRYTAAGQGGGRDGQAGADDVQATLDTVMSEAGLAFTSARFLNDGGNLVDDYAGRAVISRKFLRDNRLTETAARTRLIEALGLTHIAFIEADEQGGLEHADGVVAFIGANTLVINRYPEDADYAAALRADLEAGLPGVVIHELPTPYDGSDIYDDRFGSACGLYTNMLVTPQRIYLPQFGIPEDAEALKIVRGLTAKQVVPVSSAGVCGMGGGVRCMSWQLRGDNAARLKAWAAER